MDEYYTLPVRRYDLVDSYKMSDADYAIVCMGGMAETAEVTCDYMREEMGLKVGVVHVTSFRPFPGPEIFAALRTWRKERAVADAVSIYTVATNEQLAQIARERIQTKSALEKLDGFGPSRMGRYADALLALCAREMANAQEAAR